MGWTSIELIWVVSWPTHQAYELIVIGKILNVGEDQNLKDSKSSSSQS